MIYLYKSVIHMYALIKKYLIYLIIIQFMYYHKYRAVDTKYGLACWHAFWLLFNNLAPK